MIFARGDLDNLSPRQAILAVLASGPRTPRELTQELCMVRFRWDAVGIGESDSPTEERVEGMLEMLELRDEVTHIRLNDGREVWDLP